MNYCQSYLVQVLLPVMIVAIPYGVLMVVSNSIYAIAPAFYDKIS